MLLLTLIYLDVPTEVFLAHLPNLVLETTIQGIKGDVPKMSTLDC